ncbi:MAG: hypothetical protein HQL32_01935 [Planctomycetes bacterium]|nr:hypothetical protein [Planctomycetota bacterium]
MGQILVMKRSCSLALALLLSINSLWLGLQLEASPYLYEKTQDDVLAYLRVPLPWRTPSSLSPAQKTKIYQGFVSPSFPRGKAGYAARQLMQFVDSPLEILIHPPSNKLIPAPSSVMRLAHNGQKEEVALLMQKFLKAELAMYLGNMDWVKFKRTEEKGKLIDFVYFMGYLWIETDPRYVNLYFSYTEAKFREKVNSFAGKGHAFEKNLGTKNDDLFVHLNIKAVLGSYGEILKGFFAQGTSMLDDMGITAMNHINLYTAGEDENFSFNARGEFASEDTKFIWSDVQSPAKEQLYAVPEQATFWGAMHLPKIKISSMRKLLSLLAPKEQKNYLAWHRLFTSLGNGLTFGWSERDVAPIIVLELKDSKTFMKEFKPLMGPGVKLTSETTQGRAYTHAMWKGSALSFYIEGKYLYFSPMLHTLRDFSGKTRQEKSQYLVALDAPQVGNSKAAYYSLLHLLLNAYQNAHKTIDPNEWPAFSATSQKEKNWQKKGELRVGVGKEKFEVILNQPYGLPGFLAGLDVNSASYINFFSLLSLTAGTLK